MTIIDILRIRLQLELGGSKQSRDLVVMPIGRLPIHQREAIYLHHYLGMTFAEVGSVMGVPAKILIPPRENAKFPGAESRPQTLADVERSVL